MIVFTAFLFSSFVYLLVGFALTKSGWKALLPEGNLSPILFSAFILVSISLMGALFTLKKKQSGNTERNAVSKYVLLFALAEVPSILGLVLFLLTSNLLFLLILCSLSLLSFLLVRPSANA